MAYGYKTVSSSQLNNIVERLTIPTQSSRSWRYDYNAQEENLRYLKKHDPLVHRSRSASPAKMGHIVNRLTKPTVASVTQRWNYDCEDGNLMFLKMFDKNIQLPYRTIASSRQHRSPAPGSRISVDDLTVFCDETRPHSRASSRASRASNSRASNSRASNSRASNRPTSQYNRRHNAGAQGDSRQSIIY